MICKISLLLPKRKLLEVVKNMEDVTLKNDISRQLVDSEFVDATPPEVPEILKYGFQGFWLSKFLENPN